jgi:hypothetical protein
MDANRAALEMKADEGRESRERINELRKEAASPIYSTACAKKTA